MKLELSSEKLVIQSRIWVIIKLVPSGQFTASAIDRREIIRK